MASLRFTSFGAATVPLSKIIFDKDLDLRPYGIIARYCRAPADPTVWPTETLDWGDVPPSEVVIRDQEIAGAQLKYVTILTADSQTEVSVRVTVLPESANSMRDNAVVRVNEVSIYSLAGLSPGASVTTPPRILKAGDVLDVAIAAGGSGGIYVRIELIYTGRFVGAKTFNLSGKWLALGIDMKGLDAKVKIQGVEMSYSDYAKYFPLAPTELKIPGDWSPTQERPVIRVYK